MLQPRRAHIPEYVRVNTPHRLVKESHSVLHLDADRGRILLDELVLVEAEVCPQPRRLEAAAAPPGALLVAFFCFKDTMRSVR